MNASRPVRVVWGYRWWLLAFAVAAAAGGYTVSAQQDDTYESEALVQIVSARQQTGEFVGPEELLQIANVYAEVARTSSVAERAADRLEGSLTASELEDKVTISPQPQVEVLEVDARAGSAAAATRYARAYSEAVVEHVDDVQSEQRAAIVDRISARVAEIQQDLVELSPDAPATTALEVELEALQGEAATEQARPRDTARIIQPAERPDAPASPRPARDAVLAFLAALVLGAGVAYVRFSVTDHYGSSEDAALDLDLPMLGEIPMLKRRDPQVLEGFRSLRTTVSFALRDRANAVVLVTSAEEGAGKTFTVVNLGSAFAIESRGVVLVDADLRRASLHDRFDLPLVPGLSNLLRGWASDLPIAPVPVSGVGRARHELAVVTAGSPAENTTELMSSPPMADMMATLRERYDLVLLDTPPLLAGIDAAVLASRMADGVVFVVDARRTRRRDARRALQTLRAVEAPVLGLVYNRCAVPSSRYGYSYGRGRNAQPAREAEAAR